MKIFKANNYQSLAEHSFLVGEFSVAIAKKLGLFNLKSSFEFNMSENIFRLSGYFHDIGKIDPKFQNFIENPKKSKNFTPYDNLEDDESFSFKNHPRHNELSFALLLSFISKNSQNSIKLKLRNQEEFDIIKYAIFWHHAIPLREKPFLDSSDSFKCFSIEEKKEMHSSLNYLLQEINNISEKINVNFLLDETMFSSLEDFLCSDSQKNPIFKDVSNIKIENKKTLLRAILISADRIVSSLQDNIKTLLTSKNNLDIEIEKILNKNELFSSSHNDKFNPSIRKMLDSFYPESSRSIKQSIVAKNLSGNKIAVLQGPAGVGKTKISLEWLTHLKKESNKVFWICPRVTICQSITDELKNEYVPDLKIQILTGKFNETYENGSLLDNNSLHKFNGDVIITTIDQICTTFLSHDNIDVALMIAKSTLIFDEFHEFFNIAGVEALFREIIELKKVLNEGNTLLISATPNYYFLEQILFKDYSYNLQKIETFNEKPFAFEFISCDSIQTSDMYQKTNNNIVIFNTATNAQKSYLQLKSIGDQEKCLIAHSKMSNTHKEKVFKSIISNFGKDKTENQYDILRSGPIVQASLNISSDSILTEITNAENFLQRAGRCNRFGTSETGYFYTYFEQNIVNNIKSKQLDILHLLGSGEITKAWLLHLLNLDLSTTKLNDLYQIYENFHKDDSSKEAYEKDYNKTQNLSIDILRSNFFAPKMIINKKKVTKSNKLSSFSIRGSSSFYVSSIHLNIDTHNSIYDADYLSNDVDNHLLTLDYLDVMEFIEKTGINNLVQNQKIGLSKTLPYTKKSSTDLIIRYSRTEEYPIMLSTKNISISDSNFSNSYIYITDNDIIIGLIKLNKLAEIDNIHNIIKLEKI